MEVPDESSRQHSGEIHDAAAIAAACQRLGLPAPVTGTMRLFSGEVTGLAVQLPDWMYPVVCDSSSGQLRFDNYSGRWGDPKHLDRFRKPMRSKPPRPPGDGRGTLSANSSYPTARSN